MRSSPMAASPKSEPELAAEAAARLTPGAVVAVVRRDGGGNNRLYRVETADGQLFALKWYSRPQGDRRDRLGVEWTALSFLTRHGVTDVPRPVAADSASGFALYEWIDGTAVTGATVTDIDAALAFAERLHTLRHAADAEALPAASEACLSPAELLGQIARRADRLAEVPPDEPDLAAFLDAEFAPARRSAEQAARLVFGGKLDQPLADAARSLSPSDFGFHNALRRPDGRLAFIDFEYFGWDDPVKLVADFMQHPGMALPPQLSRYFAEQARGIYGEAEFARRLDAAYPLFGLRWCLILLNEFLPERWHNRRFSGRAEDRRLAMRGQLAKARTHLRRHVMGEAR